MDDNSTNQGINNQVTSVDIKNKRTNLSTFLRLFAIFIFIGLIGIGGYFGYRYVNSTNDKIKNLESSDKTINSTLSAIDEKSAFNNSRIDSLTSQVTSNANNFSMPQPVYANITVEKVTEDKNAALENGFRFLLVDVKLTNSNSSDVYFSVGELKLKDKEDYEYAFYGLASYGASFVKKDTNVLLPENRVPLDYASLKPGESVKGTIVYVLNRPSTKFTIYRNGTVIKDISI